MAFIKNVVQPRIRAQIAGSVMATEMTRPKSYSYHSFILEAYVQLAMMSNRFGIDIWDMSAENGNSILVRPRPPLVPAQSHVPSQQTRVTRAPHAAPTPTGTSPRRRLDGAAARRSRQSLYSCAHACAGCVGLDGAALVRPQRVDLAGRADREP